MHEEDLKRLEELPNCSGTCPCRCKTQDDTAKSAIPEDGGPNWQSVISENRQTYGAETKATNPKDLVGSDKLPMHLWPMTATAMGCLGLLDGMLKYGRTNWRVAGVRASIYVDAAIRHLSAWFEGEDTDQDSGLPHLSHALACLAILVDAMAANNMVDDRQYPGGYRESIDALTPHVARVKQLRAGHSPKHYTAGDVA